MERIYRVQLFIEGTEDDADSLRQNLAQSISDEYELTRVFGVEVKPDGGHEDGER